MTRSTKMLTALVLEGRLRRTTTCMIQRPFPSTIAAQPPHVTLPRIKTVVRKHQENDGQRLPCLDKAVLAQGGVLVFGFA